MNDMIKVVNIKTYKPPSDDLFSIPVFECYIGRNNGGSMLQNYYRIGPDGNREEVIEKYRRYLQKYYNESEGVREYLHLLAEISKTYLLILKCHCKPLACHGDVVKEALESILENGRWVF